MLVYFVRHATAEPREETANDFGRSLTGKGVRRMHEITAALGRLGIQLDEIWTSPLVRARQTANILARLAGFYGPVRTVAELSPGGDGAGLFGLLSESNAKSVALVGHEPDLGHLCSALLAEEADGFVLLKKGAVACVDVDAWTPSPGGVLQWLMQPGQLRHVRS